MRLQLGRLENKIKEAERKMDQLEAERLEMTLWAQELYEEDNHAVMKPDEYRRKQSALYNKLHPDLVSLGCTRNRLFVYMCP